MSYVITINVDDHITLDAIPDLEEDKALELIHVLMMKYGWSGTFFTRRDCESWVLDPETGEFDERSLTDEEWSKVKATWEWRKGIPETLANAGWDLVSSAVEEALQER